MNRWQHVRRVVLTITAALTLALAAWLWPAGVAGPAVALEGEPILLDVGARQLMGGSDWYHALDVVAALKEKPPEVPLVLLVGGSCARECNVSDADWAAQVDRRGGPQVVTYNISSRNQTLYEDVALVKALPRVPTIVYIGVNLGRFTSPYTTKVVPLTPRPDKATNRQHRYSKARILSLSRKKALVRDWRTRRYPVFKARNAYNLRQLERLIRACKRRGFRPVLLDLPRNTVVIRDSFYRPVQRYHQGCRALAKKHAVPFVNFVGAARLANRDFFDLVHLVEPGRVKYQRLLSDTTVRLIKRYDMVPEPTPTPTPTPSPTTEPSPTPSSSGSGVPSP